MPFNDLGWAYMRARIAAVNWPDGRVYLLDIIDSVLSVGGDRFLAVDASMFDLIVTLRPVPNPPMDAIAVRAPNSGAHGHPDGSVLIEYFFTISRPIIVVRPADDAVPLFWRFAETEFGLRPAGDIEPRTRRVDD